MGRSRLSIFATDAGHWGSRMNPSRRPFGGALALGKWDFDDRGVNETLAFQR
jgi:hypothetical protein